MKKDLINKNVVRAISLGLSAVMLTTPMTALASDGTHPGAGTPVNPDADTTDVEKKIETTDAIDAKNEAVRNVEGLVETAQQSTTDAGTSCDGDGNVTGYDSADDAALAAGEVNNSEFTINDGEEEKNVSYKEIAKKEETANEHLDNVEEDLVIIDKTETVLDGVADTIDKDVDDAEKLLGTLDQSVEDASNVLADAEAAQKVAQDTTSTEEEVKEAIADATTAVEKAETVAADAEAAYAAAKDELDAAQKAADEAQAKYEAAKATLGMSQDEIDAAQKAAQDAEKYASLLKDDVDAKEAEFKKAEADALNLLTLQQKMYDEAKSLTKTYDEESTSNHPDKDGGKLFDIETASGAYWEAARNYFKAYMQYVFDGIYGEGNVSYHWQKGSYSYGDDDYLTAGGNAYIIKYTVDGKEVTRYFNYHTIKDAEKHGSIAIYEKFEGHEDAIEGVEAVEGKDAEYGFAIVDENGEIVKNGDGSDKVHNEETDNIFVDGDASEGEEADTRWVADKESAKTESKLESNQTYDEKADTTTTTYEKVTVEEVVGTKIVKNITDVDTFRDKILCGASVWAHNFANGEKVSITYVVGTEKLPVKFDGWVTQDDFEEFEKTITKGGFYKVTYYTETEQEVTQTKNFIVEKKYAVVTTTTTDDVNDDKYNGVYEEVKEDWVDGYFATEKSAEEVATEAAEAKKAELESYGYEVTGVNVYKVNNGNKETWKYDITYTKRNGREGTASQSGFHKVEKDWVHGYYATVKSAREVAEEAAEAELANYPESEGYDVTYEVYEIKDRWNRGTGKWTYKITGTKTTSTPGEKPELVSTTTYNATKYKYVMTQEAIEAVEGVEAVPEKNWWYEDRAELDETAVKAAMEDATAKRDTFEAQKKAAADAFEAAQKALRDVDKAREALQNLKVGESFAEAMKNLEDAWTKYKEAEEKLKTINAAKDKAQGALKLAEAELERFKPAPSTGDGEPGGTTSGDDDYDTTPTTPVVVPVVAPEEIPTATVTPVAGGAGAAQNLVDIDDEDTPLAAGIDNADGNGDANGGDGDDVLVAGAEEDVEPAIVAIEDEETPLAAGSGADGKMSWWWLLIVALLGATGYKMYKEHQKKKEEAAQEA